MCLRELWGDTGIDGDRKDTEGRASAPWPTSPPACPVTLGQVAGGWLLGSLTLILTSSAEGVGLLPCPASGPHSGSFL